MKFAGIFSSDIKNIQEIMKMAGAKVSHLWIPVFLALCVSLFEGLSVSFLYQLAKGIVGQDFKFIYDIELVKHIVTRFPQIFTVNNAAIFMALSLLTFLFAILKNAAQYFAGLSVSYQLRAIINNLRKLLFRRYLSFGKLYFDRTSVGYLNNILMNFTSEMSNQMQAGYSALTNCFLLIIYFLFMLSISWQLTLCALVIFPILNFSTEYIRKRIRNTSNYYAQSLGALGKTINNALSCIPLVKAYNNEAEEEEYFNKKINNIRNLEFSMDKKQHLVHPMQEIAMLSTLLVLLTLMGIMTLKTNATLLPGFLVFFFLMRRAAGSYGVVLNFFKISIARMSGYLFEIKRVMDDDEKYFVGGGSEEFLGLRNEIRIRNLNFSYIKGLRILNNVNLDIDRGGMTAVVGESGSGKTTLVHLVMRFYDFDDGEILMDGLDIRRFTLESIRKHFALLSQDVHLFNDTLLSNLTYGLKYKISSAHLENVIRDARLAEFVHRLPDGLKTPIGDRGVRLSGGEKQRVAIARAMLKGSDILILDEATSSLDSVTENLIQAAIENLVKDKTSIVIAHRLSTIKNARKIIVMDHGNIVEEGSLNQLLEKKGKFFNLWEEQKFY